MLSHHNLKSFAENPLWISWHDSAWIPLLNPANVMDYFSEKSNPFYDRTCNNEVVKMQRQSLEQLNNMTGMEYMLLHVQEPILYVIRKQHRHSPTEATPLADYYIIAGIVYEAPDLASVFNSRLLSTVNHLQAAFEETSSYSRYHPSKGYTWDFSSNKILDDKNKAQTKKEEAKTKEEPSSIFQRQRVDMLLGELLRKFPLPAPPMQQMQNFNTAANPATVSNATTTETDEKNSDIIIKQELPAQVNGNPNPLSVGNTNNTEGPDVKDIKVENASEMKPPPEKRMK